MEYNNLGKSGLKVSRLSLGSWLTFGKLIEDKVSEKLMHYAYDQGINFFDNAEIYARGKSELVMGKILKKVLGLVIVISLVVRSFLEQAGNGQLRRA